MGSTGSVAVGLSNQNQTTVVDKLSIGDDATTVVNYYKNAYGIDIGGSYFRDKLDLNILVKTSQAIDRLVSEVGADVFKEMHMRIVSAPLRGAAMAQTAMKDRKIAVNSKLFQNDAKLMNKQRQNVAAKFHPNGVSSGDVITHEIGHNFEFLINERANPNNKMKQGMADYNQVYAKAIVQQAYQDIVQKNPTLFSSEKKARASISGYADSKWHGQVAYTETLAEAVSDYAANGQNATTFSKEIWKVLKSML